MKHFFCIVLVFFLSSCAYRNPLDKADFRFQTLNTPPYVLSEWHRISSPGEPLTVYVESEVMDFKQRDKAVADSSTNVAYLARPCQYFQTSVCNQPLDKAKTEKALQKAIKQLQKKAATDKVVVKGLE